MSTSTLTIDRRNTGLLAKAADYIELTKPRIAVLTLVIVAIVSYVASWGSPHLLTTLHALFGTLMIASSASALNHFLERRSDLLMDRTANRPLPAGRLSNVEVLLFATATVTIGVLYLGLLVNWLTAVWGISTWVVYVWIYTPLKSRTTLNTLVGAIAGALPVLIGWSASGGSLDVWTDPRGVALFLVLFLWQFPHFMAIAWIYRKQYARAGLKMLTVVDPSGLRAGVQAVLAALGLLLVSFVPASKVFMIGGLGASIYLVAAFTLGVGYLLCSIWFCVRRDESSARLLLRTSLVYLPSLFAFLIFTTLV